MQSEGEPFPYNGELNGYAIVCRRSDGTGLYYATRDSVPAIFKRQEDALKFRDQLRKGGLYIEGVFKVTLRLVLSDRKR